MLNLRRFIYKAFTIPSFINNFHFFLRNRVTIHCIGDSHLCVFKYIVRNYLLKKTKLNFCIVPGATISGIENPNSKTQAGPIFSKYLFEHVNQQDFVLICLGEVDCGFVIWHRAEKYSENIEPYFEKALLNYNSLLTQAKCVTKKIIVCSVPLPSIKDDYKEGWVAQARCEVKASQRQRTNLTMKFNEKLKGYCKSNDIIYLDVQQKTLNKKTMMLDDAFRNEDENDHHLFDPSHAEIIIDELKRYEIY